MSRATTVKVISALAMVFCASAATLSTLIGPVGSEVGPAQVALFLVCLASGVWFFMLGSRELVIWAEVWVRMRRS